MENGIDKRTRPPATQKLYIVEINRQREVKIFSLHDSDIIIFYIDASNVRLQKLRFAYTHEKTSVGTHVFSTVVRYIFIVIPV